MASARPWMRAMPSETDTTVPCVRTSAPMSRFWIRVRMRSLISDGFNCMMSVLVSRADDERRRRSALSAQVLRHRRELGLDRAVDDGVADDDACTADQVA